jgi:3-hydroxyacyl-CoA dehydrogenase
VRRVDAARKLAEAQMSPEQIDSAWEQGQQLPYEVAMALALGRPLPPPALP